MNVIYAILSITGWIWCVFVMIFLALRLRRTQ
jgi:hypothetical protein